jgi:hypothetical protein
LKYLKEKPKSKEQVVQNDNLKENKNNKEIDDTAVVIKGKLVYLK